MTKTHVFQLLTNKEKQPLISASVFALMTASLMTLVSCSDMPAPGSTNSSISAPPEKVAINTAVVIGGTIPDWASGHVRAEVLIRNAQNKPQLLAAGFISPYGNVFINLPPKVPSDLLYPLQPNNCASRLSLSRAGVQMLNVQDFILRYDNHVLGVVQNKGELSVNIERGTTYISRFYVSNDVDVVGTLECGNLKEVYESMSLKKGWNTLVTTIEEISPSGQILAIKYTKPKDQPLEFKVFALSEAGVIAYAPRNIDMRPQMNVGIPVTLMPTSKYSNDIKVRLEGLDGLELRTKKLKFPKPTQKSQKLPLLHTTIQISSELPNILPREQVKQSDHLENAQSDSVQPNSAQSNKMTVLRNGMHTGEIVFITDKTEARVPITVHMAGYPDLNVSPHFTKPYKANSSRPFNVNLRQFTPSHTDTKLPIRLVNAPDGIKIDKTTLNVRAKESKGTVVSHIHVAPHVSAGTYEVWLAAQHKRFALRSKKLRITVVQPTVTSTLQKIEQDAEQNTKQDTGQKNDTVQNPSSKYELTLIPQNGFQGDVGITMLSGLLKSEDGTPLAITKEKIITLKDGKQHTFPFTLNIPSSKEDQLISHIILQVRMKNNEDQNIIGFYNIPLVKSVESSGQTAPTTPTTMPTAMPTLEKLPEVPTEVPKDTKSQDSTSHSGSPSEADSKTTEQPITSDTTNTIDTADIDDAKNHNSEE